MFLYLGFYPKKIELRTPKLKRPHALCETERHTHMHRRQRRNAASSSSSWKTFFSVEAVVDFCLFTSFICLSVIFSRVGRVLDRVTNIFPITLRKKKKKN